ncbi:sigma-54 dependent transcriptional regulator [Terasakiella sp. A23]|uniref:sigma-54-dependent transcriptional regulator n=1 Tax=Terasakiella sp. FCG-A23 TaxID=3080561 RepID=UPI0029554B51|nr:sigma-54 dependent transcriptional regulator [Terasakiella sp. A23]MDV7341224.1 sigma-54 dependent transcriptional regulator [Terasakiella sp. A23]
MNDIKVLVIDDEKNLVHSIKFSLKQEGMSVVAGYTGEEGIFLAKKERPDIIFLDLKLPDISGMDVLQRFQEEQINIPTIMISAHGDTRAAVQAVKMGAVDYLTKPFELDELVLLVQRNVQRVKLENEVAFRRTLDAQSSGIVGESSEVKNLSAQIKQIGESSTQTVLVSGPSGTGKALVAKGLHNFRHSEASFVEVNCAALPESLMEAELFGSEKGAYTGADQKRMGLVELAEGGTLFLDEIGEMSLSLQAKILTLLESRSYRSVGSAREKKANVFVVAATNRDLLQDVEEKKFRRDLFYRLNVLPISVPALNERGNDPLILLNYFADHFARQEGQVPVKITGTVRDVLNAYDWPGNVRELKNLMERLTILYPGQDIELAQLPTEISVTADAVGEGGELVDTIESYERKVIEKVLLENNGRKGLAAEALGISRHALKRRMQRLNMTTPAKVQAGS